MCGKCETRFKNYGNSKCNNHEDHSTECYCTATRAVPDEGPVP